MTSASIAHPDATEYSAFYAGYIARLTEGDLLAQLRTSVHELAALLGALSDAQGDHRYAPGKWSIKEVVGHLTDTERIMSYRALSIARGEEQELPGFDEDAYVAHARFSERSLAELLGDLEAVRETTVRLFASLDADELARRGRANGHDISVRALAHIIAGHELHHVAILRERYLPGLVPAGA